MRSFTETTGNKRQPTEVFTVFTVGEAMELMDALTEYCQNHKRKTKCKKLLKEMEAKLEIY